MNLLRNVMYTMFKTGNLPDIDMEDFEVMWKALIDRWNIKISDEMWENFIDEVNCTASDNEEWFTKTFNNYFE